MDFKTCQKNSISIHKTNSLTAKKKCIDYVTSTYAWDPSNATYSLIYPESRKPLKGFSKGRYYLRTAPKMTTEKKAKLEPSDPIIALFLVSDFDKNADKNIPIWLYIETNSGQSGYIPAFRIYFEVTEHADILNNYFSNPPGNGIQTRSDGKFILFPENGRTK